MYVGYKKSGFLGGCWCCCNSKHCTLLFSSLFSFFLAALLSCVYGCCIMTRVQKNNFFLLVFKIHEYNFTVS